MAKKKPRHAAIIQFSTKILMDILDFKGAKVHRVFMSDDEWEPNNIKFVVEHPDLDEVEPGFLLRTIVPVIQVTYGPNGVPIKIERLDPPKRNGGKK